MAISVVRWSELDESGRERLLQRPEASQDDSVRQAAGAIVNAVRLDGDEAIRELTRRFDGADIAQFKVTDAELAAAVQRLTDEQLAAIDVAIANVRKFHEPQMPPDLDVETAPGVRCERLSHALDAAGLYVPAGTAPLPSAAIMLAVPAVIAGCPKIVLCTPPREDGSADPAVLVAASKAGVSNLFKVGGAQAIAAMAYGTQSIPKVRKIFGPGNAFVTAAKSLVSSDPAGAAIDMPAGPSEVLVIADESACAEFVAADLLSQAEHGPDSQVVFVCTDSALTDAVRVQLEAQLADLSRADIARSALANSSLILADSDATAIAISNRYAPEHLIIQTRDPRSLIPAIRNAGSVFLGRWTPESVGDYCSGTNHVLPTYGYATTYSGLGVEQFMRYMTVQEVTREGLVALAPTINCLAEMEGLDGHAAAVRRRLGAMQ